MKPNTSDLTETLPSVHLIRRFAAIVYDSILLLPLLLFATALVQPWLNGGVNSIYRGYLLIISLFYFAWPWLRSGQTLGMLAWRIQLRSTQSGGKPTKLQISLRFFMAIISWTAFGIGFFWSLIDQQERTWHDMVSGTYLVLLPK